MNALRGGARSFACLARQGNLPPFLRRPRFPCTFRVRAATFVTPLRGNGCALLGRGACLTRKRNRAALLRCLALKSEKHAALADRREALLRCGTILFPSCFAVLFRARGFPVLGGFPRGAGVRNCAALFGGLAIPTGEGGGATGLRTHPSLLFFYNRAALFSSHGCHSLFSNGAALLRRFLRGVSLHHRAALFECTPWLRRAAVTTGRSIRKFCALRFEMRDPAYLGFLPGLT